MSPPRPRRPGYTLIEVLVVIATIGMLVALLLPAVQSAREAARRHSCARHIGQLMLAVHVYESSFGRYPPGTIAAQGPILNRAQGYHHNWISQLVPYLEEKNVYRHIDRTVSVYHPNNVPVRRVEINLLRCPSTQAGGLGYSDYAGVHHHLEAPIDITNSGVFILNRCLRYEDVADGASNTLFLGEKETLSGDLGWMSGTRSTLRNVGPGVGVAGVGTLAAQTRPPGIARTVLPTPPTGNNLLAALLGPKSDWQMFLDPDAASARPTTAVLAVGGFGSTHPGGAQFAMGDGSVRFMSASIAPSAVQALANRADGQLVDFDWW